MAIEPVMADVIRKLRPTLPNNRVLCLGYPDILQVGEPPEDEERKAIAKWHRWSGGIEHAGHFFGSQNLSPEYWDVTKARGPEEIVDLNYPFKTDQQPTIDIRNPQTKVPVGLVIDPGTIEHIANIGNCWRILTAVTAIGGVVIHSNPFGWANHGFYSISPTAYIDIYEANGFEVETLLQLTGPLESRTLRDAKTTARFNAEPNAVMLCVARKLRDVPFRWPRQSKYRKNPMLKAAQ